MTVNCSEPRPWFVSYHCDWGEQCGCLIVKRSKTYRLWWATVAQVRIIAADWKNKKNLCTLIFNELLLHVFSNKMQPIINVYCAFFLQISNNFLPYFKNAHRYPVCEFHCSFGDLCIDVLPFFSCYFLEFLQNLRQQSINVFVGYQRIF